MRTYNYFTFGSDNGYGQPQLSGTPQGSIKMAINISSQSTTDNIKYKDATYIGLTHDAKVDDTYVIEYEGQKLKVLYVNPKGRLKQVFMAEI
jgi:hypothetical protein